MKKNIRFSSFFAPLALMACLLLNACDEPAKHVQSIPKVLADSYGQQDSVFIALGEKEGFQVSERSEYWVAPYTYAERLIMNDAETGFSLGATLYDKYVCLCYAGKEEPTDVAKTLKELTKNAINAGFVLPNDEKYRRIASVNGNSCSTVQEFFKALKEMTDDESESAKIVLYNEERGLEMDIIKRAKHDYSLSSGYQSDSEIVIGLDSIAFYNRL